jgi:hypothetical protein
MLGWVIPESALEVSEWAVCGADGMRPPSAAASPPGRGLTGTALLLLPLEVAAAAIVRAVVVAGDLCSLRGSSGGDGVSGAREDQAAAEAGRAGVGGERKVEAQVVDAVEVVVSRADEDRDGGSGGGMAGAGTVRWCTESVCGKATRASVLHSSVA